tara:strand:+ start:1092 stop:1577 length:486 start_codon:yes stop_codon:yes gene_type:complete
MSSLKTTSSLQLALPWALFLCLGIAAAQLWQDRLVLEKTLSSSQQELEQIKALSLEYQSLGGSIAIDPQNFTELKQAKQWLTSTSQQQGIKALVGLAGDIEPSQSQTDVQLKVSFKQVHFNRLIQWLQQQQSTNLNLTASQLTAADAGKVSGFVSFELGKK